MGESGPETAPWATASDAARRRARSSAGVYLADSEYACNGASGFFEKLASEGEGREQPHWLSSHPDGEKRIREINLKTAELGCSTALVNSDNYDRLKAVLP